MKYIFIIIIIASFISNTFINAASIQLVGVLNLSESSIRGYVAESAFYNDTCYFISNTGQRILMSRPSGQRLYNGIEYLRFIDAMRIYVNDIHLIVQDNTVIKIFNKNSGQLVRQIALPSLEYSSYFWIKNKSEIMVVAGDKRLIVYDYNTGNILAQKEINNGGFFRDRFINDGQSLFYSEGERLYKYVYSNNIIYEFDITTPKITEMVADSSKYYYMACFGNNKFLWFDYYKRDSVYVMDSNFSNIIDRYKIFNVSSPVSASQLEFETGNPLMKIYYAQNKYYLIKKYPSYVEIYRIIE